MTLDVVDARILPEGRMELLSRAEVSKLLDTSRGGLHRLFRDCSLAVLNTGNEMDSGKELFERYREFDIRVMQEERGIELEVEGAPATAFVDGQIIKGIGEHLYAVLRDVLYVSDEIKGNPAIDLDTSAGITNAVFHILRNAGILRPLTDPKLVVCWGGHSIARPEYEYSKLVGYQIGLRGLDICTGCGPGAMKGPMKGAAIGHSKQRIRGGQYLGISEPGIIAAEPPNPIVNGLVIMPDIEKRLEAFVRTGHAFVIFPGGVGTAEEFLYVLGVLLHPDNRGIPFPLVLTGPAESAGYLAALDRFVTDVLGAEAGRLYQIVVDDPVTVARAVQAGVKRVSAFRAGRNDAYYFNWALTVDREFQAPFVPTHANMRNLDLHKNQDSHRLAANLRRAFSGVVAGNVKDEGIRAVEEHGDFEIRGDVEVLDALDVLLGMFADQQRMRLPGKAYQPCYRIVR